MRQLIKKLIRSLGLGSSARFLRCAGWRIIDGLGYLLMNCLRFIRVIPQITKFEKNKVKKILIIRIDRIGDLVLSTPAIRAVKENFPQVKIDLFVNSYTQELVVNNPNIDKLIIDKENKLLNDYDLAVSLHPGIRSNYLAFLSGAKFRGGYSGRGGAFLLTHCKKDDRDKQVRHEVDSALEIVGMFGCSTKNKQLEVSVTLEAEEFLMNFWQRNKLLDKKPVIIIHPGSRQPFGERFLPVREI